MMFWVLTGIGSVLVGGAIMVLIFAGKSWWDQKRG